MLLTDPFISCLCFSEVFFRQGATGEGGSQSVINKSVTKLHTFNSQPEKEPEGQRGYTAQICLTPKSTFFLYVSPPFGPAQATCDLLIQVYQ
jgi:hypothetical protein